MRSSLRLRLRRATTRKPGLLGHPGALSSPPLRRRVTARAAVRRVADRVEKPGERRLGRFRRKPVLKKPAVGADRLTHAPPRDETEQETKPLELGVMLRVFAYMKPHHKMRNWLLFWALLRSIQMPALAALLSHIINGPITHHDVAGTWRGAFEFLILAAVTQWTLHHRSGLALKIGEVVVHDLRRDMFDHLQKMTISFYQKTHLGSIISRMTSDIEVIRSLIQEVVFVTIVALGQMLFAAVFMLWYDQVLFLLVLGLAPILWALNYYFRRRLSQALREVQESFSRVTSTLAESVSGMRVTQSFVRQDVNSRIFHDLVAEHSEYSMLAVRRSGALPPLLELNNQLFMAGLLLVGGYRILAPGVDPATAHLRADALVGYYMMSSLFFGSVATLGTVYNQALTGMAGAERVFRLLDTRADFTDAPDAVVLPPVRGEVEFRDLSFGYEPDQLVLRDVNFIARPGQTVALVGHTGSGKSSLIHLICKFYLPSGGQLLIDGQEIRRIDSTSLHRQIGMVEQVNFLFTGTVMDNIRVGRPEATDDEVVTAARRLDVHDLIEAMPEGFMSQVGERGEAISLGQRQIICFARAMLADPRIMILDEATSSVDTVTELRLQKALETLLQGRTSFVVAHRLSTIRHADLVLVLDQGRIVERGTHHQLLRLGGVYANLYRQFIRAVAA